MHEKFQSFAKNSVTPIFVFTVVTNMYIINLVQCLIKAGMKISTFSFEFANG